MPTAPGKDKPAAPAPQASNFPRGGAGPPQPLPRGASLLLLLASIGVVFGVMAMMAWLML